MAKMTTMAAASENPPERRREAYFRDPGGRNPSLYRALKDLGTIKHMVTRHEESAIHMADGYARALGTVGVCVATSGPGRQQFYHRPLHGAGGFDSSPRARGPERASPA